MKSVLLKIGTPLIFWIQLGFAALFFLRGHNEPGGGFIAGLMAAGAFALDAVAFGTEHSRRLLRKPGTFYSGVGLCLAIFSGWIASLLREPYMTSFWWGLLGTPILFDAGVCLTVFGVAVSTVLSVTRRLEERGGERRDGWVSASR